MPIKTKLHIYWFAADLLYREFYNNLCNISTTNYRLTTFTTYWYVKIMYIQLVVRLVVQQIKDRSMWVNLGFYT